MPILSFVQNLKNLTIDDKFINKRVRLFIHQTMCLKGIEKKKLWRRHNKVAKWFNYFQKIEKQPPEVFYKKLLFKKLRNICSTNRKTPVLESLFNSEYCKIFKEHLFWRTSANSCFWKYVCLWNCKKLKFIHKEF